MPTLPPHEHRTMAESFGIDPGRYDRTRPRYPAELIAAIAGDGLDVLSVGCGTGIDARQFQAAGAHVLGVEPDARMAAFARDRGLEVEVSTFETWDPAGRHFDVVAAGQAWHWVDPVAGAARAAEVLRPGGRLAVFWNAAQPPPAAAEAFAEVYRRVLPDSMALRAMTATADPYGQMLDSAADGIATAGGFGDPVRSRIERDQTHTRDEWLDVLPTQGAHTLLEQEKLDELLAGICAAIDALGGELTVRYTTVALIADRVPVWTPGP